ncbi:alkaline phosphatase PafA [Fulvivirga lutimaris]|uniref:alkaline phosphatase PafA n=1 Tax=Fulvivirga lutimaris TaxID=1819566 RepID=UPI0012BC4B99|nr:alkaline phosphatase PafA [Fulvivirga lutimaris]MTI41791.1 alkaline phosphatase family protein [Fulvivirga lutimaris]
MKANYLLALLFLSTFTGLNAQSQKPKLVVGIVVDQMRQEYLYRFGDRFQDDGFKRLMGEGFMFKNMHYNYIPTKTAPGHASIYTGTTPAIHGIAGNDWYQPDLEREVYCVEDEHYNTVGSDSDNGQMSPNRLQATTITDELMLFSQYKSKVLSMSLKDRGAVLPAGHRGDAFWYDNSTGDFITSTYYMSELPKWVSQFNKRRLADDYLSKTWNTLYDISTYKASSEDNDSAEKTLNGLFKGFPYDMREIKNDYGILRNTPFGNDILADLFIAALDNNDFGKDNYTDVIAISFSATDYMGHDSGPYSIEVEDAYLRLDHNIAAILKKLDEKVGKGNYTVFLTADHAVAPIPQYMKNNKFGTDYFNKSSEVKELSKLLNLKYGEAKWIEYSINNQLYLDHDLLREKKIDIDEMADYIAQYMADIEGVQFVYTANEIKTTPWSDTDIKGKLARGYNIKRSGDVMYEFYPGWLNTQTGDATTHGSGYSYDTHVPMLWYGNGIKKGESVMKHNITDIAPTLSMLLNISLPNGATGEPLYELFDH